MLNVFENVLAAEIQKKIFQVFVKKMFDINAFILGATCKINEKLRKIFQTNKNVKMQNVFENILAAEFYVFTRLSII